MEVSLDVGDEAVTKGSHFVLLQVGHPLVLARDLLPLESDSF